MINKSILTPNQTEELNKYFRKSTVPNVLYGAGYVASPIYDYILKEGITIDAIAVDSAYNTNKLFKGRKVDNIEDVLVRNEEINVIVGFYFDNFEKTKEVVNNLKKLGGVIKHIHFLDYYLVKYPDRIYTKIFIENNLYKINQLYGFLEDDISKETLLAFIKQRINLQIGCLNKIKTPNQYYPESIIPFTDNEVFVDCGAYNGDTITLFLEALARQKIYGYKKIFAFEPDPINFQNLLSNHSGLSNIQFINACVYNKTTKLCFDSVGDVRSMITEEKNKKAIKVNAVTIDKELNNNPISFIKMDIQGSELDALVGAKQTIKKYSPKLAICIYHKPDDLITIPHYLKEINPDYKLYIRAHDLRAAELVLYAI